MKKETMMALRKAGVLAGLAGVLFVVSPHALAVEILTGDYGYNEEIFRGVPNGSPTVYDASAATFHFRNSNEDDPVKSTEGCGGPGINRYPVALRFANGLEMQRPLIEGEISLTSVWGHIYDGGQCNAASFTFDDGDNQVLDGARITRTWDAIRPASRADEFYTIRNTWVSDSRDDCVEADGLTPGLIEDSLFDGCFQGISQRPGGDPPSNAAFTTTVDRVLMRMKAHNHSEANGSDPRFTSGGALKSKGTTTSFVVTNTTIAFDTPEIEGGLNQTRIVFGDPALGGIYGREMTFCANNRLLWMHDDSPPSHLNEWNPCFTLVTGQAARDEWEASRCNWINAHPPSITRRAAGDEITCDVNGGPNQAPIANDDAISVDQDSVSNNLLVLIDNGSGADVDPDGDAFTVTAVGATDNGGTAVVNGTNDGITYTPAAAFTGTETFTYTISDGSLTDTATVTVTVIPTVNTPPVAQDDLVIVQENSTNNTFSLLVDRGNGPDTDVDNDPLTVTAVSATSGSGTVAVNGSSNGATYTPAADFVGDETFTYTLSDGTATDTATVTMRVIATGTVSDPYLSSTGIKPASDLIATDASGVRVPPGPRGARFLQFIAFDTGPDTSSDLGVVSIGAQQLNEQQFINHTGDSWMQTYTVRESVVAALQAPAEPVSITGDQTSNGIVMLFQGVGQLAAREDTEASGAGSISLPAISTPAETLVVLSATNSDGASCNFPAGFFELDDRVGDVDAACAAYKVEPLALTSQVYQITFDSSPARSLALVEAYLNFPEQAGDCSIRSLPATAGSTVSTRSDNGPCLNPNRRLDDIETSLTVDVYVSSFFERCLGNSPAGSITATGLPAGLSLDSATGRITGTEVAGQYPIGLTCTVSGQTPVTRSTTLSVVE